MTGNLISSGRDTDLRMGVVVALALAVIVSVAVIVGHENIEARSKVALSASEPEMVSHPPWLGARRAVVLVQSSHYSDRRKLGPIA